MYETLTFVYEIGSWFESFHMHFYVNWKEKSKIKKKRPGIADTYPLCLRLVPDRYKYHFIGKWWTSCRKVCTSVFLLEHPLAKIQVIFKNDKI